MADDTAITYDREQTKTIARALFSLLRSTKSIERRMRSEASAISTPYTILAHVCRSEGPARPADLAAAACVDASVTSRALAQLEADGLVVRRRDPEDQRRSIIEATELGVRRMNKRQEYAIELMSEALGHVAASELEGAPRVLEALEAAIQFIGADAATELPSLTPTRLAPATSTS